MPSIVRDLGLGDEKTQTLGDLVTYLGFTGNPRQSQDHDKNIQKSRSNHEVDYNNYIRQHRYGKK